MATQLNIQVSTARGFSGNPSLFVFLTCGNANVTTTLKRDTATPLWNERFGFQCSGSDVLVCQVFDKATKKDVLVGETKIDVSSLKAGGVTDQWFALSPAGELHLQIQKADAEKVTVDDFELLAVIGKGSYGKVMQVKKKDTGEIFAMKVLRKDKIVQRNQMEHTKSEVNVLQNVLHPFMVSMRYSFQTDQKLYLILDYVNGGELFFHLSKEGNFSEERARLYTAEILLALDHLHRFDIIYRDLKPENLLLDQDGHMRLTDFGLCKEDVTSDSSTTTFCGTPEYMAPEIVSGKSYGKAVDWWTLGTLLYEMLVGVPPFYSENVNTMYQKILTAPLRFPAHLSADAKSILEALLQRDPSKRLGSGPMDGEEIKTHPFFKSIDWDKLLAKQVETPFKPDTKDGATDLSNFDEEFTSERPVDSVVESHLSATAQDGFKGFTYVAPSNLE
eukprot:TRINITY_DN979_c0_g2_i1.p1 TRINITY_DN979_c0_g2~~TRINITY_DN979_c0_g2_i1.p1  ORF type:complete len:446 (-),score=149.24 TRINITY_DN979_c0_g2_i1:336-1673(-)